MHCRDCEHLERKNIDVWRCRLTGAHLSAEDLDSGDPCPRDVGARPERTHGPGLLDELTVYYEPKEPKMRALWEQGATAAEIALAVGCGKRIAQYFIARFEREEARRREAAMEKTKDTPAVVTPAAEGNGEAKPLTKEELYVKIAEMRRAGAKWREIREALGVTNDVIHRALKASGVLPESKPEPAPSPTAAASAVDVPTSSEATTEKPRPVIAGLVRTLTAGAAAQYLRGIGSSLELLPGRFRISVRVEEVSEHAEV